MLAARREKARDLSEVEVRDEQSWLATAEVVGDPKKQVFSAARHKAAFSWNVFGAAQRTVSG